MLGLVPAFLGLEREVRPGVPTCVQQASVLGHHPQPVSNPGVIHVSLVHRNVDSSGRVLPWSSLCAGVLVAMSFAHTHVIGLPNPRGPRLYGWPLAYVWHVPNSILKLGAVSFESALSIVIDVTVGLVIVSAVVVVLQPWNTRRKRRSPLWYVKSVVLSLILIVASVIPRSVQISWLAGLAHHPWPVCIMIMAGVGCLLQAIIWSIAASIVRLLRSTGRFLFSALRARKLRS